MAIAAPIFPSQKRNAGITITPTLLTKNAVHALVIFALSSPLFADHKPILNRSLGLGLVILALGIGIQFFSHRSLCIG